MNVLIFGSRGYIGSQFLSLYPGAVAPSVDIADAAAVAAVLDKEKPDVVINAAGKTGRPNVDWCEDHKMETLRSNVTGPLVLLEECAKRAIYWVHLGSGCIYEGDNGGRGYGEGDPPNFDGSYYSHTKNVSDRMLQKFPVLNLRLRMPFDGTVNPRNLLMKLRGYAKVLDVPNSMTCIPEMLQATATLIERRRTGTYNMVNGGAIAPYEIMTMYRAIVDPAHALERLTLDQLSGVVKAARSNCVLSDEKLRQEGIALSPVRTALREALLMLAKAP